MRVLSIHKKTKEKKQRIWFNSQATSYSLLIENYIRRNVSVFWHQWAYLVSNLCNMTLWPEHMGESFTDRIALISPLL